MSSQSPEAYVWPPGTIDQIDRTNATPAAGQHPKDHEDLERAVNAIIYCLGPDPQADQVNVTARLLLMQQLIGNVQQQVDSITGDQLTQTVSEVLAGLDLANLALTHYVHYQRQSADTWTVIHNLGYDPLVSVIRDSPEQVIAGFDLAYAPDHMSLTVGFSQAITGRALLSN